MTQEDLTNQQSPDTLLVRSPENVLIDNLCPHCGRRQYLKGDCIKSKRTYIPPQWFRDMFKHSLGLFPLGYYRLAKCEVCKRTLAVFDDNHGRFRDEVVVLYACTLLSRPLPADGEVTCESHDSCYGCSLKNGELNVERK
jgi:hypothetical protein